MKYKTLHRPPKGWCSELNEPSVADKVVRRLLEVIAVLIVGTAIAPYYIYKGYVDIHRKISNERY